MLAELQQRWAVEAGRNNVFPMSDDLIARVVAMMALAERPAPRAVYHPESSPVIDAQVARLGLGARVTADVTVPGDGGAGVLSRDRRLERWLRALRARRPTRVRLLPCERHPRRGERAARARG